VLDVVGQLVPVGNPAGLDVVVWSGATVPVGGTAADVDVFVAYPPEVDVVPVGLGVSQSAALVVVPVGKPPLLLVVDAYDEVVCAPATAVRAISATNRKPRPPTIVPLRVLGRPKGDMRFDRGDRATAVKTVLRRTKIVPESSEPSLF
jgi:hypothetical protein